LANETSKTEDKPSEADKLKAKIEQLRGLVIQIADERDVAIRTLRRMSMDLQSITDVGLKLKEIG